MAESLPSQEDVKDKHTGTILFLALLVLAIHLLTNLLGGYGYFRDELYYIACSKHLAAGYVDQPPLSIFLLALSRLFFGESLFAIRLFPALSAFFSVVVTCLLVRRLGGGRMAMVVAAAAFIASGQMLGFHTFYSMNSFDILFWILAIYILSIVTMRSTLKNWGLLGIVLGLGLLNKTSMLWLGAGIFLGLALTKNRRHFKTIGPYFAALLALLLFSPYIIWNALNHFPHLEFMRNAIAMKYSSLTRLRFIHDQFFNMNPCTFLVSIPGLFYYLFAKNGKRQRIIGLTFLGIFLILLINRHTKSEYIAAAYPMLFAGGGIWLSGLKGKIRRWLPHAIIALLAASGIISAPYALPILPVETYIRYAKFRGNQPYTPEKKELAELPQFFADMHGWEEMAQNVSRAFLTIPSEERKTTAALVGNYGEAGAIELYARKYPLPRVICDHNSYWIWGVGPTPVTTFIRLGGSAEDYRENYRDISLAGVHTCKYCMPYENKLNIFITRGRRHPLESQWKEYKHFE